jgi:hypothetical protein
VKSIETHARAFLTLNILSIGNLFPEVELKQFLAANLYDFDPALVAGSRFALISNLVIFLKYFYLSMQ